MIQTHNGYINKKPKPTINLKCGIDAQHNVEISKYIYDSNGDTLWQDKMKKEVDVLMYLDFSEFNPEGYDSGEGWKGTTLYMLLDGKQYLWRKALLVAGSNIIDMM